MCAAHVPGYIGMIEERGKKKLMVIEFPGFSSFLFFCEAISSSVYKPVI